MKSNLKGKTRLVLLALLAALLVVCGAYFALSNRATGSVTASAAVDPSLTQDGSDNYILEDEDNSNGWFNITTTANDDGSSTVTLNGLTTAGYAALGGVEDSSEFGWTLVNYVVKVPSNVTAIADEAFWFDPYLKNVTFPDGLKTIGRDAFYYCTGLTYVTIPEGVTSMANAFRGCASLTDINIPNGVTSIGCFDNCTSLTELYLPGSITDIESSAFENCTKLKFVSLGTGIKTIGELAFASTALERVVLSEALTTIDNGAFQGTHLKGIAIPASATTINRDAFSGCGWLESITVAEGNAVYHSAGNCLIETASKTLIRGSNNSVIPADGSVTEIYDYAFEGCKSLKSVTIPNGVTTIGDSAFYECTNLKTVYVPSTLTTVVGGFPDGAQLIAADKAAYDSLKSGVLSSYASRMNYLVDVTLTAGTNTVTVKKLAGKTLGWELDERTGEWKDTGAFTAGGFSVDKWKDASGSVVTLDATTVVPADATALTYTAVDESGAELETVTKVGKPALTDATYTYGENYVFPSGFNQSLMNVKFTGTDIFGANYDSTEAPRNVGTYTVSIAPVSGYTWNDGTVAPVTAQLTIEKKAIYNVTWKNLTHLYDGTVPQVWAEIETLEGTMMYRPTVSSANAGTYPLSVTLPDVCNYKFDDTANTTADLVIKPRTVKIEWTGMNDFKWVYDGEAHNPTATMTTDLKDANVDYTVAITNGEGTAMPTGAIEAGSYKMTITLTNDGTNGNFVFEDGTFVSSCDFTILEAVKLQIVWENVADVTYDGRAHNPKAYYTLGNSGEKHYLDVTLKYGTTPTVVPNAINAGSYTATVDVSGVTAPDGSTIAPEDISGDTSKTFTIAKQDVTIEWVNYYATVAYDGKAHNPVAFYTAASGWSVKLDVKLSNASGDVENAIKEGTYTATITSDLSNFNVTGDTSKQFTIEAAQQTQITQAVWTGTTTFVFNSEAQAPVAMLLNSDGEEVNGDGETVYSYSTANGTALKSAPVNVGKYKVTATFVDKTGAKIATTSYDYEIVKAKVAKPVVALSVFASVDEAKAYAPLGYDANTMVISGEEGDGVYVVTVALKNDKNYEWIDGETGAIDFTLKISPDLSATVVGPEGVKYITNNTGNKTVFYALAGTVVAVAVISLIALIVSLRKKNKVTYKSSDNDGFYDDYEE